jgi:dolichyl-phosphate beta-glucosyltransferase
MSRSPELTLVVPAFDEAGRLARSLCAIRSYLGGALPDHEIIVVDDGSRDDTACIASEVLSDDPRASVIRLPRNLGKGAAVRAGVLQAGGRRVLFSDADLSTPIEEEQKLRAALDAGADVAIGSRAHRESHISRSQNVVRQSMGKTFNVLARALGLTGFRDTQCGFKMFRREAAQLVFGRAKIDGFAFDVEVLLLAERAGLTVVEVPVEWRNDPSSRLGLIRAPIGMTLELLRIRWLHRGDPVRLQSR